jgi:glycosyltransferase involved in cell wall biosynthesis
MPPDVALISPYPRAGERHGGSSGVASYTANLAHALTGRGAQVKVLAPREPGEPETTRDGPIEVERAYERGAGALPGAARAAIASGAPAVHVQHELFLYGGPSSVPGLVPALGALRGSGRGPVVTMHHVVDPAHVDSGFTRLHRVKAPVAVARAGLAGVQRTIRRFARAVVVHEPAFAEVVEDAHVVPHGIETPDALDAAGARARLGLDDRLTVLCFGFLAPYKGLEPALAAGRLAGDDVHMVVAGAPHPRLAAAGDAYADELVAAHGDHATFTGHVPDADVGDWFAAADVALFLYPQPFSSSGPLALALAHETPALLSPAMATCIGAPDAMVVDLDPDSVAGRLRSLAFDRSLLEPLRATSAGLGERRTWPAVAAQHLDLYREVAA